MPDSRSFRQLMGCFATGVTVVTTHDPALGPVGITINSLTSVSLEPPLVLFCLEKEAHLYSAFQKSSSFAVNILSEGQEEISRHFADRKHHRTSPVPWDRPRKKCPLLRDTLGWMICRKTNAYKGGDHTIFLGEVVELHKRGGQREPLLYVHGRYRQVKKTKK